MCMRHPNGWRKNYNMLYYRDIQIMVLGTVEVRRPICLQKVYKTKTRGWPLTGWNFLLAFVECLILFILKEHSFKW